MAINSSNQFELYLIRFNNFKLQNKYIWPIFKIGIPSALSMLIMSMGIYTYNIILSKTSNPEGALAAYATVHRIEHLFFIPLLSLSTSMITIVGMFYGAKKYFWGYDLVYLTLSSAISNNVVFL
mgnify:CR=1 FL=1